MHLSKPHEDADALVVNMVNPTAGIFDDDEIAIRVCVDPSSNLVLTTPSSGRVYGSRHGGRALMRQELELGEDSFLEYYPEPFIPHAGAKYLQHNRIVCADRATLIYFEWLSPGRVASGEVFQYDELRWETDIWCGDELTARERYTLRPSDESLRALRLAFSAGHYLGCFVIGDFAFPAEEIDALQGEDAMIGFSPLSRRGWSIKALCRDSHKARQTLKTLRAILYKALGRAMPALGRF